MKTKIISFYCDIEDRTYYSDCAKELEEKLTIFKVEHEITKIESRGNYMLNCLYKPNFILSKINENKKPLIWMDADTDFRLPFDNFDNCQEDVGFCSDTGNIEGIKATPVYFNYTNNSIMFLTKWKEECEKAIKEERYELDHDAMRFIVLPEVATKIKIKILSENYMNFFNGKYIRSRFSKNFQTKRLAHREVRKINLYRNGLDKNFKI